MQKEQQHGRGVPPRQTLLVFIDGPFGNTSQNLAVYSAP
jgi:hypothetical protein